VAVEVQTAHLWLVVVVVVVELLKGQFPLPQALLTQ
jgi:hypothetical protein